jgi:hypothetical protein
LFRSKHRGALILLVLLSAAAWMVAYNAAVSADPVGTTHDSPALEGVSVSPLATVAPTPTPGSRAGTLKIKPEKHDFGKVIVHTSSSPLTVALTNISKAASITFSSIRSADPFLFQTDQCSGTLLAPGNTCHVVMVFVPEKIGKIKENPALIFVDSAKNSPQKIVFEGVGIAGPSPTPTISATPTNTIVGPSLTPTATITPSPFGTAPPTPTATVTPTGSATATCTVHASATPDIAHLVLITGGQASNGTPLSSAEIFDPVTNIFTLTSVAMHDARYSHAAAAINTSGGAAVVVTGGVDPTGVAQSTETFTGSTFATGPSMTDSREGHTATSFQDDSTNVLIAGGQDSTGTVLNTAEVTNTLSSSATSPMNTARVNAATVLLAVPLSSTCPADVVVTGGSNGTTPLQTAELFNPANNTFTLTDDASLGGSQMNAARAFHTATLLPGEFLVAGGEGADLVSLASAEIFNVATNKFTLTTTLGGTDMTVARQKHTATAIGGGMVLIAGGLDSSGNALASAEVFDLSTNSFSAVGSMHSARYNHAASILPSGKVLITGGEDGSGNTLNTAEIFDPMTNTFTLTTDASLGGNNMNVARKLHTATAY